jgi:Tol biopolymer transport system component/DNA-binding winged helix-turn-helix (wHTH) protein
MRDVFMMGDPNAVPGAAPAVREIVLALEKSFRLADTAVRPAALEVEFQSQTTSVEPRVMQVLVALSRLGGEPASRERLIEWCWGGRVVTDGALNRSIAQLRKALRDPGIEISTIPRVGYRLRAAAAVVQPAARPPTAEALTTATSAPVTTSAAATAPTLPGHLPPQPTSGVGTPSDEPPNANEARAAAISPAVPVADRRGAQIAALVVAVLALAAIAWALIIPSRAVIWTASNFRPLTSTLEQETYPALSPEGTQIVYASRSNAYGARDLFLRNVNEGTPVQLTSGPGDEYGAAWSPDGNRIAFARSVDDQSCALVIMPIPSGAERVVARCENGAEVHPSWLDAHTLLYSDRPASRPVPQIRAVDIETGAIRDLTSPSSETMGDTDPQAAPDGRQVAFRRTRFLGADDLLVLDARTGAEHAVTSDGWKASGYVWSADSRHIFFASNRGGEFGLWSVDARGLTAPRQVSLGLGAISFAHISVDRHNRIAVEITRSHNKLARFSLSGNMDWLMAGAGSDGEPAVAPDGTVAHVSNRSGLYEVWVYSGGSGAPTRLTSIGGSYVLDPAWSPDSDRIAFVGVKGPGAEIYTVARDGSQLQQRTTDMLAKDSPVFAPSGRQLLYLERHDGGWRMMELGLNSAAAPRAVPGGEGWVALHTAPDGTVFGRRSGETSIRQLSPLVPVGSGVSPSSAFAPALPLQLTNNDVWAIGKDGVYVRRGRRIERPSSLWFFPWQGTERRIADVPLASGDISVTLNGDVLVSQGTSNDMDLAMLELQPLS